MPAPGPGDAVLVERLRGDEPGDAMRALFRLYGGELHVFTLQVVGDRAAAADVVEAVFLRAWCHAESYDPEREAVRAWLYRIARDAVDVPAGQLEQAMLGSQVAAALEQLTPEHRQVIRMVQSRGLTMREIAANTGLPVGTVKRRTWYALQSLRLVLEEMGVTAP